MVHVVTATAVLAVVWVMIAIGGAIDPAFFEQAGRLVQAVGRIHI